MDDSTAKELLGPIGLQIWNKALSSASLSAGNHNVPLDQFVEAYLANLTIPLKPVDKPCLATIFSDYGENREDYPMVTKRQLALFLLRFGPPDRTLDKIRDVLQNGKVWFHGNQSRQVSELLLKEATPLRNGLFLVRYSSVPGAFTVDYVKDGKLCHFNNIRNDPKGGVQVIVGKPPKQQIYKYSSLSAFVGKNKHLFAYPCTNPRSHFQWMKVQIPAADSVDHARGLAASAPATPDISHTAGTPEEKEDARKQRVTNAIQKAYKLNGGVLELRGFGLGPSVPSQIVMLKYLTSLDLSRNAIEVVPSELGNLYKLKSLNLSYNKLSTIPGDIFLSLGKLNSFVCSDNALTGLPLELFTARKLSYLDFSCNMLTELSPKIGSLRLLQFLDLSSNTISSLPDSVAELTNLEELYIKGNQLKSIPSSLASAPSLMVLDASHNQIAAMPEAFYTLLKSNPKFVSITTGNPVDAEISRRKEAEEARGPAGGGFRRQHALHQSVDIFQLLGIPPDERGTFKMPESMFPAALGAPPSEIKPVKHSLWVQDGGHWLEDCYGPQVVKMGSLTFQERNQLSDYENFFYGKTAHVNIIGTEKTLGNVCISIQKVLTDNSSEQDLAMAGRGALAITGEEDGNLSYRVLLRTKQGDQRLFIPASMVKKRKKESVARTDELLAALKKLMKPIPFNHKTLWAIRDVKSHDTFATLESRMHSNAYKFGALYAKDGQGETEMYRNVDGSPGFNEFMRLLGDEVCLRDWPHYRGGLSARSDWKSIYTKFHDNEIMFHVSTMLPYQEKTDDEGQQWERKRYLGNDIVMLLYYEGSKPVDPTIFKSNFNHVFCMVVPEEKDGVQHYRVYFTYKVGVADSIPRVPEDNLFEKGPLFREWLLTKLINSERCAMEAAQFRIAQERVRNELFLDLQTQFPKKKERGVGRRAGIGYMSREEASSLEKQLTSKGE